MKIRNTIIPLLFALALTSCTGGKVYDRYQHTPVGGWERNDTLTFADIARFSRSAVYTAELGLRISGAYPFMGLTLIVDKHFYPRHIVESDTIDCSLIDHNGNSRGVGGVGYYQYRFELNPIQVSAGDSIVVSIRHNMKREILPGISDVGLMLTEAADRSKYK